MRMYTTRTEFKKANKRLRIMTIVLNFERIRGNGLTGLIEYVYVGQLEWGKKEKEKQ